MKVDARTTYSTEDTESLPIFTVHVTRQDKRVTSSEEAPEGPEYAVNIQREGGKHPVAVVREFNVPKERVEELLGGQ